MPIIDFKSVIWQFQKSQVAPLYWLQLSSVYLIDIFIDELKKALFITDLNYSILEGQETNLYEILQKALQIPLGEKSGLLVIKNANSILHLEKMDVFMQQLKNFKNICVFISVQLDKRKKATKHINTGMLVVQDVIVSDAKRKSWIQRIAQRNKITLSAEQLEYLNTYEPWTIDSIVQQLQMFQILPTDEEQPFHSVVTYDFVQSFLTRNKKLAYLALPTFLEDLASFWQNFGLLNWYIRELIAIKVSDHCPKKHSFLEDKIRKMEQLWTLSELSRLTDQLWKIDIFLKQKEVLPVVLFHQLVNQFCLF